jgi:hypothetical protein
MAKQLTKLELLADLARLREHCNFIETKLARTVTERDEAVDGLHRLKSELLGSKLPAPPAPAPIATRALRVLPPHMAAARELAMRIGRVVKVSP